MASLLGGCASASQTQLQEGIRKAAGTSVLHAHGDVAGIFKELAQAGRLDPQIVYVASQRSEQLNAAAAGKHHFYVTRGAVALGDTCFLTGIAAHEIAHDLLKHPETKATASDATAVASTILGVAAGAFVPGAGYLVSGAASLGLRAYSRSQEEEADALAVKLLRDAGKPEWALRYAFERLQEHYRGASSGGWLSTHPALAERIAAQPPLDLAAVRQRCPWAPGDPPAWCRGGSDRYDASTGACVTG
jgi:predicted Zn-dependent protease